MEVGFRETMHYNPCQGRNCIVREYLDEVGDTYKLELLNETESSTNKKLVYQKQRSKEYMLDGTIKRRTYSDSFLPKEKSIIPTDQENVITKFFVKDHKFKVKGTMKNGEISHIKKLKGLPRTPEEIKELGPLAQRFVKKFCKYLLKK